MGSNEGVITEYKTCTMYKLGSHDSSGNGKPQCLGYCNDMCMMWSDTFRKANAEPNSNPDYNTVSVRVVENTGHGGSGLDPAQPIQPAKDPGYSC